MKGSSGGDVILYKILGNYEGIEKLDTNRQRKAVITDVK